VNRGSNLVEDTVKVRYEIMKSYYDKVIHKDLFSEQHMHILLTIVQKSKYYSTIV